jgi:hypothetical protein
LCSFFLDGALTIRNAVDALLIAKHRCQALGWNIQPNANTTITPNTCSPDGDCSERCRDMMTRGEDRYFYELLTNVTFDGYSGMLSVHGASR